MLLLVPADPLSPKRPDDHFLGEYRAAQDLGFDVGVINYETLIDEKRLDTRFDIQNDSTEVVYRGWMLDQRSYRIFTDTLENLDFTPVVTDAEYYYSHHFSGWHQKMFRDITPRSTLYYLRGPIDPDHHHKGQPHQLQKELDNFGAKSLVIRDQVHSMKHYWDEACFIPDATDFDNVCKVMNRFFELRGPDLVNNVVIREYEQLVEPEVRTWWVNGECVLISAHPDTPNDMPNEVDYGFCEEAIRTLPSGFVTVDLAMRSDGVWRVVEVGNGQVSDRTWNTIPAEEFVTKVLCQL